MPPRARFSSYDAIAAGLTRPGSPLASVLAEIERLFLAKAPADQFEALSIVSQAAACAGLSAGVLTSGLTATPLVLSNVGGVQTMLGVSGEIQITRSTGGVLLLHLIP